MRLWCSAPRTGLLLAIILFAGRFQFSLLFIKGVIIDVIVFYLLNICCRFLSTSALLTFSLYLGLYFFSFPYCFALVMFHKAVGINIHVQFVILNWKGLKL